MDTTTLSLLINTSYYVIKKSIRIKYIFVSILFVFLFAAAWPELCASDIKKINIDVTTHLGDVENFHEGDVVSFLVSIDHNAYLYVIYQDARGNIIQLIPNNKQKSNYYKAGLFLSVPTRESGFTFKIQAPFGQERLWVFASATPFPNLKGKYLTNGLRQLSKDMAGIKKIMLNSATSAYGEASLAIHTRTRK